jgi:hypothetical protein
MVRNSIVNSPQAESKTTYSAPQLTFHGSVADLTQAMASGASVDKMFPAGTPLGSLTFS